MTLFSLTTLLRVLIKVKVHKVGQSHGIVCKRVKAEHTEHEPNNVILGQLCV